MGENTGGATTNSGGAPSGGTSSGGTGGGAAGGSESAGGSGPMFTGLLSNIDWDGAPYPLLSMGGAGGESSVCDDMCTRITTDQILRYEFDEGDGTVTRDSSQVGEPVDLIVPLATGVIWESDALILATPTVLESMQAAKRLGPYLAETNAITVEAWIEAANLTQGGPARIVTMSTGGFVRNFMLAQEGATIHARLRTTDSDLNGEPNLVSPEVLTTELTHVVYTRTPEGDEELVMNALIQAKGKRTGTFDNWDNNLYLAVGGELDAEIESRDFQGTLHGIYVYRRALSHEEIVRNYLAGP